MANKKNSKNAKGAGTIRKRSDGRWEARYSLGFDPKTGKQVQKSIYGATQREVLQKLAKITTEIEDGSYTDPTNMKLGTWLDIWLADYTGNLKRSTYSVYESHVRFHLKPNLGQIQLTKLAPHTVQHLYNELMNEKGLSAKTVKNIHGALHKAMEQAKRLGYIRSNPLDAVIVPRVEKKQIETLADAEMLRFLETIKGEHDELIYFVTVFTGLRQGEVLGLTWDCVDFEHHALYINKQLQKTDKVGGEYVLVPTKNSRSRVVTVADSVMQILKEEKRLQEHRREIAGVAWSNPWDLVFTNEFGGHLCHFSVYHHFKNVVGGIGLGETRFHDLRHSYAVGAIESGDDIKTVQSNLGHATASFTLDVYGHVSQKMRQQSADRMERFIQTLAVPASS